MSRRTNAASRFNIYEFSEILRLIGMEKFVR